MYPYKQSEKLADTTSYINTVDIASKRIETVYCTNKHIEAPNWHKDGYLLVNSYGRLHKIDLETCEWSTINTGSAIALNNDHGLSPDQKPLVLSNYKNWVAQWKS